MTTYAELEIELSRLGEAGSYQVELRFGSSNDQSEKTPVRGAAALDLEQLFDLEGRGGNAYGLALAEGVFADRSDNGVRARYGQFKATLAGADELLRVKLFVDRSAPELHPVRWELLVDPDTQQPLATSERILFSRFGSSNDWRRVRLRAKAELRALVAVAGPSADELAGQGLAPVDVAGEVERARGHLEGVKVTVLGEGDGAPVTVKRLVEALRDGIDILYLVCHGGLGPKGPVLYLQGEDGKLALTAGDELARRVGELVEPPRLVVLASCESAGSEQMSAQTAVAQGQLVPLAPALADAGVHAIVAMQGKISMETVKVAMPVFFAELLKDGQIDRAFAVARGTVRERPDSWMPALYLRLKGGRIWYEPGFGEGKGDFAKWRAVTGAVSSGQCTPIVGPGLGEGVYGPLRDATRRIAERRGFPLAEHERFELQQVSQFVQYDQDVATARDEYLRALHEQIRRTHPSLTDEEQALKLGELVTLVGQRNRDEDSDDPYRLLAQLDAKLFVTANHDNLLEEALRAAGKTPETAFFSFRERKQILGFYSDEAKRPLASLEEPRTETDADPREPLPDVQNPLVFHIFGHLRYAESLVLTEDDYFDYFVSLSQNKPLSRTMIGQHTLSTSLLFLGFGLTDWSFRVLYRLIMGQEGSAQLRQFTHVAVQVDPEEDTLINPRAARKYLEDYFGKPGATERPAATIFWGTAGEFLKELNSQLATAVGATSFE